MQHTGSYLKVKSPKSTVRAMMIQKSNIRNGQSKLSYLQFNDELHVVITSRPVRAVPAVLYGQTHVGSKCGVQYSENHPEHEFRRKLEIQNESI